jgi:DNA-binding NarL/FixJ family response regulator
MARILILDDQELVRFAISSVLKSQAGIDFVATAATESEAIKVAAESKISLLLTETVTPDFDGLKVTSLLMQAHPNLRVIALTNRQDEQMVSQAMQGRIHGYVLKKCPFGQLMDAIRAVSAGQMYLCPDVVGMVVQRNKREAQSPAQEGAISDREREVLQLVAEGLSTKEVADKLSISLKTVETHRRRVMSKLKLFSVAQLTKYAIRQGLTSV